MDKDIYILMAATQFACWRMHPGYLKEGAPKPPSLEKCVHLAEVLWDISQQLQTSRRRTTEIQ